MAYLANEAGPVPLVLDLRIVHDRIGSSANPALNGTLTHPNNIDESLNKTAKDKIRKYLTDYNNNPRDSRHEPHVDAIVDMSLLEADTFMCRSICRLSILS